MTLKYKIQLLKRRGQAGEPKIGREAPSAGPGRGGEPRQPAENQKGRLAQDKQEDRTGKEPTHD